MGWINRKIAEFLRRVGWEVDDKRRKRIRRPEGLIGLNAGNRRFTRRINADPRRASQRLL